MPTAHSQDEVERAHALLDDHPDYRVLTRLTPRDRYHAANDDQTYTGIYLDTETTGLNAGKHDIIEIGMIQFTFDAAGRILDTGPRLSRLNDPGHPLDPKITEITGLTNADLHGHHFDDDEITTWATRADLYVAHNAGFDRPFMETRFPILASAETAWACSLYDVPWTSHGYRSRALEHIAHAAGHFFDAHRAINDCDAALYLLATLTLDDGRTPFEHLLQNARRTTHRIYATRAAFDHKDTLKARGYTFNGDRKTWYTDVQEADIDTELTWLASHIYAGRPPTLTPIPFTATTRYSKREP